MRTGSDFRENAFRNDMMLGLKDIPGLNCVNCFLLKYYHVMRNNLFLK